MLKGLRDEIAELGISKDLGARDLAASQSREGQENVKGNRPRAAHYAFQKKRAAWNFRSEARPRWRCYLGCMVGLTAGIPRQRRKISAAVQLFTLIVAGLASRNVSGVSGRSLMSRFAVTSATVVPAAAPTGPPIAAPIPPPAKAPIKTPPPAP